MIRANESTIMWLWVDDTTSICFPETMYSTEDYARHQAERILGKRRMPGGTMRAVRITIAPLSDEETATERARYADWKAAREKREANRAADRALGTPEGGEEGNE